MNRVNMLLTEIALNLLGNTFYNINGYPVDDLNSLFKIDESEQTINPNKKSLKEILAVGAVACSMQRSDTSDDDDVVHVELPEEIITVEDDDGEVHGEQLARSLQKSAYQSTQRKPPTTQIYYNDTSTHSTPSTSVDPEPTPRRTPSESIKSPSYMSPNANVRLNYFKRAVMLEYERMLKGSEQQKQEYLATNRHLLTILKLNEKELTKRYHVHQKQELYAEIHTLMQFIRIIKSNDKKNQEIISKVAKDILAAKSDILK